MPSCGHTGATFAELMGAYKHGLRHLTHFCNQMTKLHHREIGVVGAGFRLTLADHWMNPCDETGPLRSPFSIPITSKELPGTSAWHELAASWDEDAGTVTLTVDGKDLASYSLASLPPFGLSYLHLQTLAEDADAEGTYFRSFRKE